MGQPIATITGLRNELDTLDSLIASAETLNGAAGGVLTGSYPNPSFAVNMATQAELDAVASDLSDLSDTVDALPGALPPSFVGTQANLTALTSLSDGQKVHVLYRSSISDGGGGDWVWDAASTTTEDGGTILEADAGGTGRWKRVFDGVTYQAAWYGAKADGTTDNSAIMDTLLDDLPAGATLVTPPGVMMMSAKVSPTRGNINLDFRQTTFKFTAAGLDDADNSYFFHFSGTSLASRISNIELLGGRFDVSAWRDGTQRVGSGTCPSQSGMTTSQIKLGSGASAVDDFYNGMYIFLLEGTGRGQEAFISDYVGATKIATISSTWTTQPDNTTVYGVLLDGSDADDQATRGIGRVGFTYCEDVNIRDSYVTGGHGGFDFRGCSRVKSLGIEAETLHENAYNYLDECDNCQLFGFRFIDVGEGIDHGNCEDITGGEGIISLMAESDDEGLDFNGVKKGAYSNILIYGGNNSINIHAGINPTYQNLDALATYNVTLSNIQCYDFKNAGFIVQLGRSSDTVTTDASQAGMAANQIKFANTGSTEPQDEYTDDSIVGQTMTISAESHVVTDYVASTRVATFDGDWVTSKAGTSGTLIPTGPQANDLTKDISLTNCRFESTQSAAHGVWIGQTLTSLPVRVAGVSLHNCHIRTSHIGCRVSFAKNVHIVGGSCYSTADRAHYWGYSQTYFCEDCSIRGHEMRAVTDAVSHGAFQCDYGINVVVDGCTVLSNTAGRGIYMFNVRNPRITNNVIRSAGQEGIYVDYSAAAFTDTTWSGVTSRNIYNADNNLGVVINGNEVWDWLASQAAIRVNYGVATAANFRGIEINNNVMLLDAVANSSHAGIRLGHHASVTGLAYRASDNLFDRNLSTKFHLSSLTAPLPHETAMNNNLGNTTSRNEGTGQTTYLTFFQDNVAASQSGVELTCVDAGAGAFSTTRWTVMRPGTITGIQVKSNGARSGGTLTVEVYKTTTASGLTAILDGTNTTTKATYQRANSGDIASADVFAAGDEINVRITTDGSWSPTTADIQVVVELRM